MPLRVMVNWLRFWLAKWIIPGSAAGRNQKPQVCSQTHSFRQFIAILEWPDVQF